MKLLEVRDLSLAYGDVQVLFGVSLSVGEGEIVTLLGSNGAGKTTTLDALLGLSTPDAGRIAVFGAPPRSAIAAGRVGAVLQDGALLTGVTVRELIASDGLWTDHPATKFVTVTSRNTPVALANEDEVDVQGVVVGLLRRY